MIDDQDQLCFNCRYFRDNSCRRDAPGIIAMLGPDAKKVALTDEYDPLQAIWPTVPEDSWCGEWQSSNPFQRVDLE